MIIVTATLSFATTEDRDAAVEASAPIQRATRDDEPGCVAYCFAADPAAPTHIQVYELWTDADSLAAHFEHPNYAEMVRVLGSNPGFLASDNRLWAADDRGPVYGDDRSFRADAVADAGG
ncbi:MAG: antibiotic biosynthesis monooxygenase [Actinomycetota bacterium]